MKREFQDVPLACWEEKRGLGFTPPFLCIQGDAQAAAVLLAAIEELATAGTPSQRVISLRPHGKPNGVRTIRLRLSPVSDDLRQMSLTRDGTTANLEFTERGLAAFRDAAVCWLDGGEDFGLHPDGSRKVRDLKRSGAMGSKDLASGELWFWTPRMDP